MPNVEQALSIYLGLVWSERMQDWDLTNANAELLPSLFGFLHQQELSDDELFSAMSLTVASVYELFMLHGIKHDVWEQLKMLILRYPGLNASTIWYWAGPSLRGEEPFPVSSHMADLWQRLELYLMSKQSA